MLVRDMLPADCAAFAELTLEPSLGIDPGAELGNRLTRAWVACAGPGAAPVGYALGWWVLDELQLLAIGVLPAQRGRGAGSALLAGVLEAVWARGGRRVILEVARSNTAARRLYERAGFEVFNVRRGYYAKTGDDALEMERCAPRGAVGAALSST